MYVYIAPSRTPQAEGEARGRARRGSTCWLLARRDEGQGAGAKRFVGRREDTLEGLA